MTSRRLTLAYPGTVSYAGQTVACEITAEDLVDAGISVDQIEFPAYDRGHSAGRLRGGIRYGAEYIGAVLRVLSTVFHSHPVILFSHSQTLGSLLRQGVPHLIIALFRPRARIGVILHGGLFLKWDTSRFQHRFFVRLLHAANLITVSSEGQKQKLIEYGICEDDIRVLWNTTDMPALSFDAIPVKVQRSVEENEVHVLFLSALLDVKGFAEFLEAMEILAAQERTFHLKITLCGPVAFSGFCNRFSSIEEKQSWITTMVERLHQYPQTSCTWIEKGIREGRDRVYQSADIFVLPSLHPMESQPLVLVEAMASGCAIVTSTAGSIAEAVGSEAAVIVEEITASSLAEAVLAIAIEPKQREAMAVAGRERFEQMFTREKHRAFWQDAFRALVQGEER